MKLQLHNTLGDRREPFEPSGAPEVTLYHCGPTVKEPVHVGKFRSYLLADVLRRHLEREGLAVRQVMNVTDVGHLNEFEEDAVEIAAARRGLNAWELAAQEEEAFHRERRALGILDADEYPRAREHVECMIQWIEQLEARAECYMAGGRLWLDTSGYEGFGELGGGARARAPAPAPIPQAAAPAPTGPAGPDPRRNPRDIELWRTEAGHQQDWKSPWGRGYPGWHVECAAMCQRYLGVPVDVHTGAIDNISPHHEAEIAQAHFGLDQKLARVWLHSGPVLVESEPMRRDRKNLVTVRELLASGIPAAVVRVALLSAPYRAELDLGEETFAHARIAVDTVRQFRDHLLELAAGADARDPFAGESPAGAPAPGWVLEADAGFRERLDDDLDYPGALVGLVHAIGRLPPEDLGDARVALGALVSWDRVLGIL